MSTSWATAEGTARYRHRFADRVAPGHFRQERGLWFSSIGLGTYLGGYDDETDARYRQAIIRAVELGCNVIDTAINYRFQRSERAIGQALRMLFGADRAARDELIIATKGGYIPFDGAPPVDTARYMKETFFDPGIITPADLTGGGWHCMTPRYLEHQLETSLDNLGLECIDIYYVHNPEQQLGEIPRAAFAERLRAAFEFLEAKVAEGKIRLYGVATWNGFRQPPEAPDYLSLRDLVDLARDIAGIDHHFRVIQLPYNLGMLEALGRRNQPYDGEMLSTLEAAARLGIIVMTSASILQSRLARGLPAFVAECLSGLDTDAQRAIQFVRSTPGVTTALVGMSQVAHVEENLETAQIPPAPLEDFLKFFRRE